VLGAVEVERAAAQHPAEQADREHDAGGCARPLRGEHERKRREHGQKQEVALAGTRHAAASEQR
jgi:hypothetical protein